MRGKLARCLIIVVIFLIIYPIAYNSYRNSLRLEEGDIYSQLWNQGTIDYGGNKYQYNTGIKTYLIMGIDSMEPVYEKEDKTAGGQADSLFLLVVDDTKKKWSILSVNRNTMAEIEQVDKHGMFKGNITAQICVQHGFGDGMEESCKRQADAISRTLFGLPIDGYIAVNMGAIAALNDTIGGVSLTSIETIDVPPVEIYIPQGEEITLQGLQAWAYNVYRDEIEVDGATRRLERQKQYIDAAYNTVRYSKEDKLELISNAYEVIKEYTVMDVPAVELAYKVICYKKDWENIQTFPGDEVSGERFVEFYLDKTETMEILIDTYYERVDD